MSKTISGAEYLLKDSEPSLGLHCENGTKSFSLRTFKILNLTSSSLLTLKL